MGVLTSDAPQWLLTSFVRSALGAGATAGTEAIEEVGQALLGRWADEHRAFHNLRHLAAVLHRVDQLAEETHEPDLVRLAAWYHGAVFDATRKVAQANQGGEQTTVSANLARTQLTQLGLPEVSVARTARLVDSIDRHKPLPDDVDSAVLNDADLAMLAAEPQRYKAYMADVRAEYSHIPLSDYLDARVRVLTKLLQRSSLYFSPMGAAWEEAARQNLDGELHRLLKERRLLEEKSAS
jgi:predicted metal-dependent HD superfamily phosphohydrolase